jgi:BNR/Asp-box repeat.
MKQFLIFVPILLAQIGQTVFPQTNIHTIDIFQKEVDGYNCYRIPAMVQTTKGTLLAFAEARKKSCSDTGDIDLVVKRSTDGGKTWSPMIKVWDDGNNVCGNPAPVIDKTTGRVILVSTWNRGDDHEKEILDGTSKDTRRVYVLHSDDDGLSWSNAKEITPSVKKDTWTWYATGPCHGIQLQGEKYKNRLVISSNHMVSGTKNYHSQVIYSDDSGETWHLGGVVSEHGGNESSVVELKNGDLMLNMRNYNREENKSRSYAISKDGGISFGKMQYATELIEPICQANILNATKNGKLTEKLLFSNPASTDKRERMTVRLSRNSGKTWESSLLIQAGPTAYSDMVMISDQQIGLYYEYGETNPYEKMGFAIILLSELDH